MLQDHAVRIMSWDLQSHPMHYNRPSALSDERIHSCKGDLAQPHTLESPEILDANMLLQIFCMERLIVLAAVQL